VVKFTLRPLYLREKLRCPFYKRLGGPQSPTHFVEEKILFLLTGFEPRIT
jgi:hypothetical protein